MLPVDIWELNNGFKKKGGILVGRYSQKAAIGTLPEGSVKSEVAGGFCGGICMDWIRRTLLGGQTTFVTRDDKVNEYDEDQVLRAAIAYILLSKKNQKTGLESRRSKFEELQKPHDDERTRLTDLKSELLKLHNKKVRQVNNDPELENPEKLHADILRLKELLKETEEELEETLATRNKIIQARNTWEDRPLMEKYWKEYASKLDEKMSKNCSGKFGHRFDRLKVIKAIDKKEFLNGMVGLMREVTQELHLDYAAHMQIYAPSGAAHAVAIIRQNTGTTVFFDPNLGTYEFWSLDKLKDAVAWLFGEGYPNLDKGATGDAHVYEITDGKVRKVRGDYTIFGAP